ncbi:MAG: AEC family transporter [Anaerostipes sp.]|uniref:AEC family transporter n=1 Tax=Anaerostipes sp. 992a TaxID=1261637 RepID=UPI0009515DD1|nr:AEC family transporter [Anaerostipes sp. 992a]MCI5952376.1 AEC family transporter [Anaerostipes sp.]MDD5968981.1 AEC family transporter [Anaerostipes sp.]OLR63703.1 autotransporter [Anaerostipes sp. 992a]
MELSLLLAQQIIALFLMMIVGFFLVKIQLLTVEDSDVLAKLVVYVFSPCVIIQSFVNADYTKETFAGLMVAILGATVVHIIYILLSKLGEIFLGLSNIEKASLVYSNAGNLIIPLVTATLGEEWVFYSCAYIIVSTILFWSHGKSVICEEPHMELMKVIKNPNIIAIILGLIFFVTNYKLPSTIDTCTSSLGVMIGPASMMVIGMLIANMKLSSVFRNPRAYLISCGRLCLYPMITILVFCFSGILNLHQQAPQILLVTLLAAAAPCAANVTQVSQLYHKDALYASALNVMSVIFCVITMPLMVAIYQILL